MKSRLLSIILIILVAFSFASCGANMKKTESTGNHQESSLKDVSGNNKDNAPRDETDKPAEAGDIDESELPEGFRTDLVPIFKGGVIVDAQEDPVMPEFLMYMLTCYSDKPYAVVEAFYKQIMSNYRILDEQADSGFYYVTGYLNDTDAIDIVVQDLSQSDHSELPKGANTLFQLMYKEPKKGEIPDGYRSDLVPVMEGSKLKQDRVFDSNGKKVYSLTFETTDEYEDVIAFYREIIMDVQSMRESESPFECNIEGTIDNAEITISISMMPSGREFKTAYTIHMTI